MKKTFQKIAAITLPWSVCSGSHERKILPYNESYNYILILIIGFAFLFNTANAQVQWKWAKNAGNSISRSVAADNYGNIYAVGEFVDPSILFDTISLTGNGGGDAYIVKYNSDGNVLWAKGIGGADIDRARSVCTDPYGNIYVAGEFWSDTIVIDTFVLSKTDYGFDVFIAKYDGNGNVLWAKSAEGNYIDYVTGIAANDQGEVYIIGSIWGNYIVFDTIILYNSGNIDMYIAKYDIAGNAVWAQNGIGNDQDEVYSISVDNGGNVLIGGSFRSDSISFGNKTLINSSDTLCFGDLCYDAFLVKFDENGIVEWAVSSTGKDWDETYGVVTDTSGNIYTTGIFISDTIYFDTLSLVNHTTFDVYISKYNTDGIVQWVTGFGGNSTDYVEDMAIDNNGNIYIGGGFDSDSLVIGNDVFVNKGSNDIYVAKYDNDGNNIWAAYGGGNDWDLCLGVTVDLLSNVYLAGYFSSNIISFDTINLNKMGNQDMFIAKIGKQNTYIEENAKKETLKVYPNPFNDLVHIEFDNQKAEKHVLDVYTTDGKLVLSINDITTGHVVIERKNLTGGMYFFRLWNNRQVVAAGKLIIE
ncbi:SBBP repeat-containing protein [candidate division KSB1 bacterium]